MAQKLRFPQAYWASFEHRVESLDEYLKSVQMISAYQAATGSRFVWRGMSDARWALHSSLVRAYLKKYEDMPTELQLQDFEREVIDEAREWALDWHSSSGRLAALELLAALQHYSVPTRLLDFTFNPLIALWFAIEQNDQVDGRVVALDISGRIIERDAAMSPEPWWFDEDVGQSGRWTTEPWIWRPPPLEPRIVRQEGCFLMGGIPLTVPARNVRVDGGWRPLRTAEVRASMSVPLRLVTYQQAEAAARKERLPGQPPRARAFTLRISRKAAIREELQRGFGYSYRSLFPDFPGFASYGSTFK